MPDTPAPNSQEPAAEAEVVRLRSRVVELEAEVAYLKQHTATLVAQAQETAYWFDRWGVDFNRLFSSPGMEVLRRLVRGVRAVYRAGLKLGRRL